MYTSLLLETLGSIKFHSISAFFIWRNTQDHYSFLLYVWKEFPPKHLRWPYTFFNERQKFTVNQNT